MKKKKKLNKKKFLSRVLILIIILIAIFFFIKSVFYKKDDSLKLTLIVNNQDISETLASDIYIDKDGILYMSMEDVKNIFDKNIYYEESTGKIITTYGTKVGAIDINNNTIELNTAEVLLSTGIINYDYTYYIPISEIDNIYNIEVTTTDEVAIISSLYKELVEIEVLKTTSLKEDSSFLSSTIQKLEEGTKVIFVENSEKEGWLKVLTYNGKIGYIQEKKTGEKDYKRIDMEDTDFSSKTADLENSIEIDSKILTNDTLKNFKERKQIINDIIAKVISEEKYTININLNEMKVEESTLERFIIELTPRLKEIGSNIIITNNSILSDVFLNENNILCS